MGDSAGGNLAITTMLYIRDHIESFKGMPAGIGLLSGWLDLTHALPSYVANGSTDFLPLQSKDKKYINENRNHYYCKSNAELPLPYVSPLYAAEDLSRPICPIFMQVGSQERLRDENIVFASTVFANSPVQVEIYEGQVNE